MSERLFHHRCFLNDESGAAMLEATVEDNSWADRQTGERRMSYDGTLHITDCSRSIELTFGVGCDDGIDDMRSVLRKLDRLIDAAQDMRDAFARAAKREFPGKKF